MTGRLEAEAASHGPALAVTSGRWVRCAPKTSCTAVGCAGADSSGGAV